MTTPDAEMPPKGRGLGASLRARQSRWRLALQRARATTHWHFFAGTLRLLWEYRRFSITSLCLTIFQEIAALWPARLLGQFVDRLETGDLGNVVWLFMGASVLYPLVLRTNVVLSNKMMYEMEAQKRIEWTRRVGLRRDCADDAEQAGSAITRIMNAVSATCNLAFYSVRSIAPIFVKVIVVSSALLAYSQVLGLTYLAGLSIPIVLTILYNKHMRALRDRQYGLAGQSTGAGVKAILEGQNDQARSKFLQIMVERRNVLFTLVAKSQLATLARTVALIGSQFAVVFVALAMRQRLGLTPGDFTTIVGYTGQVAAATLGVASVVDAIVDLTRAYSVYVQAHGE
jgi:ABC-type multidrug transport system fused ATPase/permease subunit